MSNTGLHWKGFGEGLTPEQNAWRWRILISTYFAYAGYYLTRRVFTICKTTIAADFDIELSDMAHIWTAFLVAYMIGQFLSSYLGRRYGPRILLLGGLGISMLINVVFGFTNSYATFMAFMFFNGLVQATGWPGVVGGISRWLRPSERGKVMGVWSTSYQVGSLAVKYLGGALLAYCGWRWSFWGCTLAASGLWLLVYLWQRDDPREVGLDPIVDDAEEEGRAIQSASSERITFREYLTLATHPVVLTMGISYFCIKFMRYALDSWLPAFLNIQGMSPAMAATYSSVFEWAGLGGAIVAGWALDRIFRGNWAVLCFTMGLGMLAGYLGVVYLGVNPVILALCYGLIGFMMYGPDTILAGAASVAVAGKVNGVALAGLVNGIASVGPVIQEQVIGWLIRGDVEKGIYDANILCLSMSILYLVLMLLVIWRLRSAHRKNAAP